MREGLTRRRAVELGLAVAAALAAARPALGAARRPLLSRVRLSAGRPYAPDGARLATGGRVAGRRGLRLHFRLAQPSVVSFEVLQTGQGVASERPVTSGESGVSTRTLKLAAGAHTVDWTPDPALPPRTYVLRLAARHGSRL